MIFPCLNSVLIKAEEEQGCIDTFTLVEQTHFYKFRFCSKIIQSRSWNTFFKNFNKNSERNGHKTHTTQKLETLCYPSLDIDLFSTFVKFDGPQLRKEAPFEITMHFFFSFLTLKIYSRTGVYICDDF